MRARNLPAMRTMVARGVTALLLVISVTGLTPWCAAEVIPHAGPGDRRIQYVSYNRNQVVVVVDASYGASTMITFDHDEHIETLALGDAEGWKVEPNHAGNVLFVKPVKKHASDDLNVLTNKHTYIFVLNSAFRPLNDQVFDIIFRYPDEAYSRALLNKAKAMASSPNLQHLTVANINSDYGFKGSSVNKPVVVFDDGVKTWFRFRSENPVPAIFAVDQHRNESLVNVHREGKYIIVDRVNYQWTLRDGKEATCVFNLRLNDLNQPTGFEANAPKRIDGAGQVAKLKRAAEGQDAISQ